MGRNLDRALASPESKSRYVRRLFATIADRYDLITVVLSYGRDRHWKERLLALAGIAPRARVLDLACGTGDIAFDAARAGARVVGLDVTPRMVELARSKARASGDGVALPIFLVGDMMQLPFADRSFDVVTTGYGLRNVPALGPAIAEIARVMKPGGTFVSLDFNRPESPVMRAIYLTYLGSIGAAFGWLLHRDPDTYRYIPATIRRYPGARRVAVMLNEAGFRSAEYIPVLGGLMAIHRGVR